MRYPGNSALPKARSLGGVMDNITTRCWITLFLMIGAAAMIAARRYKNNNHQAGYGIAGWVIFFILQMWWSFEFKP